MNPIRSRCQWPLYQLVPCFASLDLFGTHKREAAPSRHSASSLWGDLWVTGLSLVLRMLICGEDGAVGRGSLSSLHSAVPGLRGGGCSTLSAFPRRDDCPCGPLLSYPLSSPLLCHISGFPTQTAYKQTVVSLIWKNFFKKKENPNRPDGLAWQCSFFQQPHHFSSAFAEISSRSFLPFLPCIRSGQPRHLLCTVTSSTLCPQHWLWEPCSVLPFPVPSC